MKRVFVWGLVGLLALGPFAPFSHASSHREAPLISQDPAADNTDVYAFVSPADPGKVTLISNFIPLEAPYGGPNFFGFDDNVLYEIHAAGLGGFGPSLPQVVAGDEDVLPGGPAQTHEAIALLVRVGDADPLHSVAGAEAGGLLGRALDHARDT